MTHSDRETERHRDFEDKGELKRDNNTIIKIKESLFLIHTHSHLKGPPSEAKIHESVR